MYSTVLPRDDSQAVFAFPVLAALLNKALPEPTVGLISSEGCEGHLLGKAAFDLKGAITIRLCLSQPHVRQNPPSPHPTKKNPAPSARCSSKISPAKKWK